MTSLTRARVVEAALSVVAEEGLPGLSMRRMGRALGVEAMALYRHVRNKDDLLDALYDHIVAQVDAPAGGPWEAEVEALATSFRDVIFRNRACVPLLATRPGTTPNALAMLDRGIGVFQRAGFDDDSAIDAFQTVFAFVVGHAVFHTAGGRLPDDALARREFERGLGWILVGLRNG
ncbi:MAG: TetR/AcrR family transcriptional regulator C-terminal domain-containing protein [Myxococcota bacterium]